MNIHNLTERSNSSILSHSKIVNLFSCPTKYYFTHHCHLTSKESNSNFIFGKVVHKAIETFLKEGSFDRAISFIEQGDLQDEKERDLAKMHLSLFVEKISSFSQFELLQTEKSVFLEISKAESDYFDRWYAKCDFIYADEEGVWNSDNKTTSKHGPSVAKYYHNSGQTLTYFYIMKSHLPSLTGSKIFILTKMNPRCEIETIPFFKEKYMRARSFISHAINFANQIEEVIKGVEHFQEIPKFQTSCESYQGRECPYTPLCFTLNLREDYLRDLINNWYRVQDPDEHLELGE